MCSAASPNSGGETEINKLPFMSQPSYTSSCLMLFVILRTYKRAFTLSLLTIVLTPVRHYAFSVASASCELRTFRISDTDYGFFSRPDRLTSLLSILHAPKTRIVEAVSMLSHVGLREAAQSHTAHSGWTRGRFSRHRRFSDSRL